MLSTSTTANPVEDGDFVFLFTQRMQRFEGHGWRKRERVGEEGSKGVLERRGTFIICSE